MKSDTSDQSVVAVPAAIAVSNLSLAEIGALVVVASLQSGAFSENVVMDSRLGSDEMRDAVGMLKEKNLLKINVGKEKATISINLKPIGL